MSPWQAPPATGPVTGEVTVPGSKSTSARSLLLAALASGPSTLTGVLRARDTDLMRAGLSRLGVGFVEPAEGVLQVRPPAEFRGGALIDVGLSGTVLRFLPPIAALASPATGFFGDPEAAARPVAPLLGALADLGAQVSRPYHLPFEVSGGPEVRGGAVGLDASASSQFLSALLLVAARLPDGLTITHTGDSLPSLPHIEMTVRMLAAHGVAVDRPSPITWQVQSGPVAPLDEAVEPDLTNAASLLAAALVTGGRLTSAWPEDSLQGADAIAQVLAAFGATIGYQGEGSHRRIVVEGPQRLTGADLDLHATSELTPVAAALAALADGPSTIRGVAHVRRHETDRLAALETELNGLGARVRQAEDGLVIEPAALRGGVFHTYADHRLAHAGALLGLAVPGIELDDVACTSKTLPEFPTLWTELVGR